MKTKRKCTIIYVYRALPKNLKRFLRRHRKPLFLTDNQEKEIIKINSRAKKEKEMMVKFSVWETLTEFARKSKNLNERKKDRTYLEKKNDIAVLLSRNMYIYGNVLKVTGIVRLAIE